MRSWRDRPQIRQMVKSMAVVQGFIGFLLAVLVVSVIATHHADEHLRARARIGIDDGAVDVGARHPGPVPL